MHCFWVLSSKLDLNPETFYYTWKNPIVQTRYELAYLMSGRNNSYPLFFQRMFLTSVGSGRRLLRTASTSRWPSTTASGSWRPWPRTRSSTTLASSWSRRPNTRPSLPGVARHRTLFYVGALVPGKCASSSLIFANKFNNVHRGIVVLPSCLFFGQ